MIRKFNINILIKTMYPFIPYIWVYTLILKLKGQ